LPSGASVADFGAAVAEFGAAVADSGASVADSGASVADSGASVADSGAAVADFSVSIVFELSRCFGGASKRISRLCVKKRLPLYRPVVGLSGVVFL
jgi:hypothetical protein